jgi:hypothetical protein
MWNHSLPGVVQDLKAIQKWSTSNGSPTELLSNLRLKSACLNLCRAYVGTDGSVLAARERLRRNPKDQVDDETLVKVATAAAYYMGKAAPRAPRRAATPGPQEVHRTERGIPTMVRQQGPPTRPAPGRRPARRPIGMPPTNTIPLAPRPGTLLVASERVLVSVWSITPRVVQIKTEDLNSGAISIIAWTPERFAQFLEERERARRRVRPQRMGSNGPSSPPISQARPRARRTDVRVTTNFAETGAMGDYDRW